MGGGWGGVGWGGGGGGSDKSDCADGQAGLRLCCSQTPEDRFSRVEAHLFLLHIL